MDWKIDTYYTSGVPLHLPFVQTSTFLVHEASVAQVVPPHPSSRLTLQSPSVATVLGHVVVHGTVVTVCCVDMVDLASAGSVQHQWDAWGWQTPDHGARWSQHNSGGMVAAIGSWQGRLAVDGCAGHPRHCLLLVSTVYGDNLVPNRSRCLHWGPMQPPLDRTLLSCSTLTEFCSRLLHRTLVSAGTVPGIQVGPHLIDFANRCLRQLGLPAHGIASSLLRSG